MKNLEAKPLNGQDLIDAVEATIVEAKKWGLEVIKRTNNTINKNNARLVNHLTIEGGERVVEYYPSKGKFHSMGVRGKSKTFKGLGLKDAIEFAKNGKLS